MPYKFYDSVLYGNPVQIRSGPATVSVEERSEPSHWRRTALGRQFRSDETRARRPAEFTSIEIDLEGKVDGDSGNSKEKHASFLGWNFGLPDYLSHDGCAALSFPCRSISVDVNDSPRKFVISLRGLSIYWRG
jgi:hypothetical protein